MVNFDFWLGLIIDIFILLIVVLIFGNFFLKIFKVLRCLELKDDCIWVNCLFIWFKYFLKLFNWFIWLYLFCLLVVNFFFNLEIFCFRFCKFDIGWVNFVDEDLYKNCYRVCL